MRLADYVAHRCALAGAKHVFLVTGGGAMHLNDAFNRHKDLETICFHHEQAASMAAESYYRTTNRLAVLNVTTGPGGINALNGVYGAYTDSIGMIVISGQVKLETHYKQYSHIPMRQLGDQEVDIVSMVKPIVKYAKLVRNPYEIRRIMDKALFLATSGRPGPVWIDIPIDISSFDIDLEKVEGWDHDLKKLSEDPAITENTYYELVNQPGNDHSHHFDHILNKLSTAKRPVLFVGAGVRISNQYENFLSLVEKLGIPTVAGWNANDLIADDNPCYAGRPGTVGDRAGNFTVQNSDLIIILGSRLNIRQISYNHKNFAHRAYKIMVDIDATEIEKPTLKIDYKIVADLKVFIPEFLQRLNNYKISQIHTDYLKWCKERVTKYSTVLDSYQHNERLNPYLFVKQLSQELNSNDVVVMGNGSASVIPFQAAVIKKGQRLFANSGCATMGYDLPGAIGASIALDKQRIICIAGDGSIMMNLQEIQTVVGYNLPVKILIINNNGYLSIKTTQTNYFRDNVFGTGPDDGVSLPDFVELGKAFKLKSFRIFTLDDWNSTDVKSAFNNLEPALFEIMVDPAQPFAPKLAAKKLPDGSMLAPSLEFMSPFLSDEEMKSNIIED